MGEEPTVDAILDPSDMPRTLARAAAESPTAVDVATGGVWVLRYDEVDRLAHDQRMAGVGLTWFDLMGIEGDLRRWYGSLMFTNEGDAHSRLRRLVSRAFTPRSVERLRAVAATHVEDTFRRLETEREGDLVGALGRLAIGVMCNLLGVPEDDVNTFGTWADALSPVFGFMEPEQIDAAQSALAALLDYITRLVEKREGDPADDLITALVRAEEEGDRLTREEVVTMVANLLVGGHDTTSSQIGCTLLTLMRHPGAAGVLRSDPAVISTAVTETMRYEPSIGVIPRTVSTALEIGGISRPAGTPVLLSVMTANRDPSVWERPDSFEVDRFAKPEAPRLLSFGIGPHYCLGANLARMTLEETMRGYVRRDVQPLGSLDDIKWRLVLGRSPASLPARVAPLAA
jgi:cytochrome P450